MKQKDKKLACTVTIGDRGQFVIPKKMRDMFDIQSGDSIIVLADENRGIAIPPKDAFEQIRKTIFNEESSDDNE